MQTLVKKIIIVLLLCVTTTCTARPEISNQVGILNLQKFRPWILQSSFPLVGARADGNGDNIDNDGSFIDLESLPLSTLTEIFRHGMTEEGKITDTLTSIWLEARKNISKPLNPINLKNIDFLNNPAGKIEYYFALGDSYTAGPNIPDQYRVCGRSNNNYPGILEKKLNPVNFADVSCSSAATTNLFRRGQWTRHRWIPPQAEVLVEGFESTGGVGFNNTLITVGIGGNDEGFFTETLAGCLLLSRMGNGNACRDQLNTISMKRLNSVGIHVRETLRAIRYMQSDALVLLIGYTRLARADKTCSDFPLKIGDAPWVVQIEEKLDSVLKLAAEDSGVYFLTMHEISRNHEICSDDPVRLQGKRELPKVAHAFHPTKGIMELVAQEIQQQIKNLQHPRAGKAKIQLLENAPDDPETATDTEETFESKLAKILDA